MRSFLKALLFVAGLSLSAPLGAESRGLMKYPWLEVEDSGFSWLPVHWFGSFNGQEPSTSWSADGAIWQGAGFNTSLRGGFRWAGPFWEFNVDPLIWWTENTSVEIPTDTMVDHHPPFGDAHFGVWDHPLRMGDRAFAKVDGGQSFLKLNWGSLFLMGGTLNRVWGPSTENSILLSANGPGIPSVELGLDPWSTDWGTWEAHLIYGRLSASGYQSDNGKGGTRLWSGLFLGYQPSFWPDLSLGAARTANSYMSDLQALDFLLPFTVKDNWGVDKYDQRLSLMYDYHLPSIELELYGEWARNDFSPALLQYIVNLEHTQNWVLGFRQGFGLGDWGHLRFDGELGVLSLGIEGMINYNRYSPMGGDFYTHWLVTEGYTIEGQELGSAAGNGNFLLLRWEWTKNPWGAQFRIVRWVKDYSLLVQTFSPQGEGRIDVSYLTDLSLKWDVQPWTFRLTGGRNLEYNRLFRYQWESWHLSGEVTLAF